MKQVFFRQLHFRMIIYRNMNIQYHNLEQEIEYYEFKFGRHDSKLYELNEEYSSYAAQIKSLTQNKFIENNTENSMMTGHSFITTSHTLIYMEKFVVGFIAL